MTNNIVVRSAPPNRAAEILKEMGYPHINAKLLRKLYRDGVIPGVDTGHKLLLPIARIVEILEGEA